MRPCCLRSCPLVTCMLVLLLSFLASPRVVAQGHATGPQPRWPACTAIFPREEPADRAPTPPNGGTHVFLTSVDANTMARLRRSAQVSPTGRVATSDGHEGVTLCHVPSQHEYTLAPLCEDTTLDAALSTACACNATTAPVPAPSTMCAATIMQRVRADTSLCGLVRGNPPPHASSNPCRLSRLFLSPCASTGFRSQGPQVVVPLRGGLVLFTSPLSPHASPHQAAAGLYSSSSSSTTTTTTTTSKPAAAVLKPPMACTLLPGEAVVVPDGWYTAYAHDGRAEGGMTVAAVAQLPATLTAVANEVTRFQGATTKIAHRLEHLAGLVRRKFDEHADAHYLLAQTVLAAANHAADADSPTHEPPRRHTVSREAASVVAPAWPAAYHHDLPGARAQGRESGASQAVIAAWQRALTHSRRAEALNPVHPDFAAATASLLENLADASSSSTAAGHSSTLRAPAHHPSSARLPPPTNSTARALLQQAVTARHKVARLRPRNVPACAALARSMALRAQLSPQDTSNTNTAIQQHLACLDLIADWMATGWADARCGQYLEQVTTSLGYFVTSDPVAARESVYSTFREGVPT